MALEQRRGFKPDHDSFGEFILSEQARDPAVKAAHEIAALAAVNSPRSKNPDKAHMADQFKVNERPAPVTLQGNPRAVTEVYNESPAAAPNEFGGPRNRRHRMLGRAGAAIGEFRGFQEGQA